MPSGADNRAMRVRGLIALLILAIVAQSCWAVGEWLHTHEAGHSSLTAAALTVDLHYDGLQDDATSQAPDSERDHHHSCFAHSPFVLPAHLVTAAEASKAFIQPALIPRLSDAPPERIDRPNWRSPA